MNVCWSCLHLCMGLAQVSRKVELGSRDIGATSLTIYTGGYSISLISRFNLLFLIIVSSEIIRILQKE